jgi:hypothetical protein
MSVFEEDFLIPESGESKQDSSLSVVRSALVADLLRRGDELHHGLRLRVYGESMLPSLWPGDWVEIAGCSLADVRPGEILLAQRDDRFFLHRLIEIRPEGFVLQGDSVPRPDPLYPVEALLGRLVGCAGGKWSRAAGRLLCHCDIARHLALKFHRHQTGKFRNPKAAGRATSTEVSAESGPL